MIVFSQLGTTYSFSVSWNSIIPGEIINYFNITVNPKTENGLNYIFTNDASVTLILNNETEYFLSISVTYCTGMILTRTYHVGKNMVRLAQTHL